MPDHPSGVLFADRREAGRQLARALLRLTLASPLVLALPRGGVPVAAEIAEALRAPLDVLLVRKLGAPGAPEVGIGALVEGEAEPYLNPETVAGLAVSTGHIAREVEIQRAVLDRQRQVYRDGRSPPDVKGETVVLVDDGIATGGTALAAVAALRRRGAKRIVLAVPVAPSGTLPMLQRAADEVVCLASPSPFGAVSLFYESFEQTTDEEVMSLLAAAGSHAAESVYRKEIVTADPARPVATKC